MKKVLSGNEAFARAAYEAGVGVVSSYPGTPSTEILKIVLITLSFIQSGLQMRRLPWRLP